MISEQDPALQAATPPIYQDGRLWDNWKIFQFNFNADPKLPPWGELNVVEDVQLGFYRVDLFINYLIQDDPALKATENVVTIDEPIHILQLSTTNSAHSLSELASFIKFYREHGEGLRIGVNTIIEERLPFLYQLLLLFIDPERIIRLDASKKYAVRKAWLRRNIHMNQVMDISRILFVQHGDLLAFHDLQSMNKLFLEDPTLLNDMAAKVHAEYAKFHTLPERVMLLKSRDDFGVTTPGRAMEIGPEVRAQAEAAGIKVMSIGDFKDIHHYLATLYGAKVFVTSYGGPACTNRFFCSPSAQVILLANLHYQWEYEYPSAAGDFWHTRHSHLFPVAEQLVILNHANEMSADDLKRLQRLMRW